MIMRMIIVTMIIVIVCCTSDVTNNNNDAFDGVDNSGTHTARYYNDQFAILY